LGFNVHGSMTPSRAVIALRPASATSTRITEFNLTAKSVEGVKVADAPVIMDAVGDHEDGIVSFVFTLPVGAQDGLITTPGSLEMTGFIYAVGPRPTSETQVSMHTDSRAMSVALTAPASSNSANSDSNSMGLLDPAMRSAMVAFHAVTMVLTWFVLIPLAALFAAPRIRVRMFSGDINTNPRYTLAHKIAVALALITLVVGLAIGYFFIGTRSFPLHFALGTVIAAVVMAQCMLGMWRTRIHPARREKGVADTAKVFGHAHKNAIAKIHAWTGRGVWVLAVINVFLGLHASGYPDEWRLAAGVMVVAALALFLYGPITGMQRS